MKRLRKVEKQRGMVLVSVMVITVVLMLLASTLINYFLTSEAAEVENSLVEVRTYWAMMGHVTYMLSRTGGQGVCNNANNALAINQTQYCGAGFDDDGNTLGNTLVPPFNGRTIASPAGSLQSYLDNPGEIQTRDQTGATNIPTIINPGSRRWVYPQEVDHTAATAIGTDANNPYYITVQGVVRDHYVTPPAGGAPIAADDRLRVDLSVVDSGTIPALYDLKDHADRLTIGFCVTDSAYSAADPANHAKFDNMGCVNNTSSTAAAAIQVVQPSSEGVVKIQFVLRNAPIPLTSLTP